MGPRQGKMACIDASAAAYTTHSKEKEARLGIVVVRERPDLQFGPSISRRLLTSLVKCDL